VQTNENSTKKTYTHDTAKKIREYIDTIREQVPGDARSLS
jgi:hypothetical protein